MRIVVCPSQDAADAVMAALDSALGYPKRGTLADGSPAGTDTPSDDGWTLHATGSRVRPTDGAIGVELDDACEAALAELITAAQAASSPDPTQSILRALPPVGDEDATWWPPPLVLEDT